MQVDLVALLARALGTEGGGHRRIIGYCCLRTRQSRKVLHARPRPTCRNGRVRAQESPCGSSAQSALADIHRHRGGMGGGRHLSALHHVARARRQVRRIIAMTAHVAHTTAAATSAPKMRPPVAATTGPVQIEVTICAKASEEFKQPMSRPRCDGSKSGCSSNQPKDALATTWNDGGTRATRQAAVAQVGHNGKNANIATAIARSELTRAFTCPPRNRVMVGKAAPESRKTTVLHISTSDAWCTASSNSGVPNEPLRSAHPLVDPMLNSQTPIHPAAVSAHTEKKPGGKPHCVPAASEPNSEQGVKAVVAKGELRSDCERSDAEEHVVCKETSL
mmetsp:Transcript_133020/g.384723  ORF Transcript_133020/g.384723 Transcript_133020/m.384723 type:complete len:334 (+) Transcript_133020:124-1125(+)